MEYKFLEVLLQKMDKMSDDIGKIKELQAVHNEVLKDHTRRSELNEESNKLLKQQIENTEKHYDEQLEPIKKHVNQVEFGLKIFGATAAISAFILTVIQIVKSF